MKQKNRKPTRHRRHGVRSRRVKRRGQERAQTVQSPWLRIVSAGLPAPEYLLKTSG